MGIALPIKRLNLRESLATRDCSNPNSRLVPGSSCLTASVLRFDLDSALCNHAGLVKLVVSKDEISMSLAVVKCATSAVSTCTSSVTVG